MRNPFRLFVFVTLMAMALLAAYFIGKKIGQSNTETSLIENYSFVRTIAELATLEVNGQASIKSTNIQDDGSFFNSLYAWLGEQTVQVQVPYRAKYGVDLQGHEFSVTKSDSVIEVVLPQPQLLSYELRLDKMQTNSRKGVFVFQNDNTYTVFQKKLYDESRRNLEQNHQFVEQSKLKLDSVFATYFKPFSQTVRVSYR